ncbi:phosphatase PAP2 family protein [Photobacterium sanctipauli]|uniref:undecaprenyl-diphosphate phosphatase n=2 Tax=Photobacterium sanctipauli TaxID=1342794 RepID=A0A2T3NNU4_9GAMM|nr:phosphatase PAP2 family protein [Photobacterium sanctipauli]PSW17626.1 phosphatase PAP2 family protein [Photobacterium sanctipauli]
MARWLVVFLLCFLSPLLSAQEAASQQLDLKPEASPLLVGEKVPGENGRHPEDIIGAVCVIRHGDKLVMMSEVITRKLSLPGGYIDTGDTPEQAARREALEETGIDVTVSDLIQYRGRAAIYSCVAKTPILVSSFRDYTGHLIVASWFSKHFATEIERVYLIDPQDVSAKAYRYAEDAELLPLWLEKTPNSEVLVYSDLSDQVNFLHQLELVLIKGFQQGVSQWPQPLQNMFEGMMFLMNLPGEPWFVAVLLVAIAGFFGPKALIEFLFVLILASFTSSLLKYGIASPRPSVIIPELQKINAYGFGFPSGHTLLATLLWGIFWHVLLRVVKAPYKWLITFGICIMIAGQAVARVWYGVHFISDTIMSVMLGLVIVALVIVWRGDESNQYHRLLMTKWFWLFITMVVGIVASFTLVPSHAYLFAGMLGVFLTCDYVAKQPVRARKVQCQQGFLHSVVIALGFALLAWTVNFVASLSTVSLLVLAIKGVGAMIVTVWLVGSTTYLHCKYQK